MGGHVSIKRRSYISKSSLPGRKDDAQRELEEFKMSSAEGSHTTASEEIFLETMALLEIQAPKFKAYLKKCVKSTLSAVEILAKISTNISSSVDPTLISLVVACMSKITQMGAKKGKELLNKIGNLQPSKEQLARLDLTLRQIEEDEKEMVSQIRFEEEQRKRADTEKRLSFTESQLKQCEKELALKTQEVDFQKELKNKVEEYAHKNQTPQQNNLLLNVKIDLNNNTSPSSSVDVIHMLEEEKDESSHTSSNQPDDKKIDSQNLENKEESIFPIELLHSSTQDNTNKENEDKSETIDNEDVIEESDLEESENENFIVESDLSDSDEDADIEDAGENNENNENDEVLLPSIPSNVHTNAPQTLPPQEVINTPQHPLLPDGHVDWQAVADEALRNRVYGPVIESDPDSDEFSS